MKNYLRETFHLEEMDTDSLRALRDLLLVCDKADQSIKVHQYLRQREEVEAE
ncbi:hypothetical protein Q4E40_02825 [Pontibacter sp. BT731]|uniref:hypothetical protein n=1 Tax=Pontibacter coccineus TaxID=3063328 RepID=UPI0026E2D923|nr:hypothetical protein [Pontibacter sp. BT731]MDO6389047.1 hypothetical protein [Pontibacter sp. BT731]